MSRAQYMVRFDDICPTMNWSTWEKVESLLVKFDIKPILAVVPDNQDSNLAVMPPREDFWDRVRYWQSQGWTIALHGFQHQYETVLSGMVGLNNYSEFAGLTQNIQRQKLESGLKIFESNNVAADAWIAPAHSFDEITVELLTELGIRIISDGYYWRPVQRLGAVWVPQQLWSKFRKLPFGIWTVCYHTNGFTNTNLERLESDLQQYHHSIVGLSDILSKKIPAPENYLDRLFSFFWSRAIKFKSRLRK